MNPGQSQSPRSLNSTKWANLWLRPTWGHFTDTWVCLGAGSANWGSQSERRGRGQLTVGWGQTPPGDCGDVFDVLLHEATGLECDSPLGWILMRSEHCGGCMQMCLTRPSWPLPGVFLRGQPCTFTNYLRLEPLVLKWLQTIRLFQTLRKGGPRKRNVLAAQLSTWNWSSDSRSMTGGFRAQGVWGGLVEAPSFPAARNQFQLAHRSTSPHHPPTERGAGCSSLRARKEAWRGEKRMCLFFFLHFHLQPTRK